MKKTAALVSALVVLLGIGYINPQILSHVWAEGGLSWGTPMTFNEYLVVGNNDEIEKGHYAFVFQKVAGWRTILKNDWESFLRGDVSVFKKQLEDQIPGGEAVWFQVHWDDVQLVELPPNFAYRVQGLYIEALVKNKNAGLTGLEICAIIIAIAILASVIGFFTIGGFVTWNIMNAANELGPWVTIIIGVGILVGLGVLFFVFIGGKFNWKGKGKGFTVGKGKGTLGIMGNQVFFK